MVAEARGLTMEQAIERQHAADAVGVVAEALYEKFPDKFVGSALAPNLGEPPILYVKGAPSPFIDQLLADAPLPIEVRYGQPFSFSERRRLARFRRARRGAPRPAHTSRRDRGAERVQPINGCDLKSWNRALAVGHVK